jgi:Cytochrome c/Cytochrome c7 and related cytochrome c
MFHSNPLTKKLPLLTFIFVSFFSIKLSAQDGQALFMSRCASCHSPLREITGPKLGHLEERHKWSDHNEILKWVHNPAGYMAADKYTQGLKNQYGSMMAANPDLTIKDIDAIVTYINGVVAAAESGGGGDGGGTPVEAKKDNQNAVIFGVISLILAIITLILMHINSNLKKMSDDAEGINRPEPVPFYRNKVYIAIGAMVFFAIAGFYLSKAAVGLGRQTGYQPVQPIFYSHKVHAGINQINCLYCHGSAWESKTAGIPAVNICMNCHRGINEYGAKSAKIFDGNGEEVNGSAEIAKLYKYAAFDPKKPNNWDATKAKPVEWVKIHNLPDHVYFNHSQHVRAGKVQCQTCHGEITAMDEVKQVSELSMGWCINCHRQTKVNFNYDSTGNKFYSIYERFHNDIKAGKMDSVTVKDIGGLECQKCHY